MASKKRKAEEPDSKYYLNASFMNKDEQKYPGFYEKGKKDEKGDICYAFTKDIELQFHGKPQMTSTFNISYFPKLYKFMMDNEIVKRKGIKIFERIYELSVEILSYSKDFIQKKQYNYDHYHGIVIYLLSYYFARESWKEDQKEYFKSFFYFKPRTNPILLLQTPYCYTILVTRLSEVEFDENIVDFFEMFYEPFIYEQVIYKPKKKVIYVKNHPIIFDRYFEIPEQKVLDKIGKEYYEKQYYCNQSFNGENDLGKITLNKGNLLFDRFSVEVFDWPPSPLGAEYISIEFRDLLLMFYLAIYEEDKIEYHFEKGEEKQEYMVEQNTLTKDDYELLDYFVDELYNKGYDMCACEDLYTLIKLLFKNIIFPVFKGEKQFQFGIEFETNLLQCNFEHHDRKKIWEEEKVTVTSETMHTVKNHLPKDEKYYDCVSAVYGIKPYKRDKESAFLCVYALEGQVGIFTFDLDKKYPVYNLDDFKKNMDILCAYINKQIEDKTVFVEEDFYCSNYPEQLEIHPSKDSKSSPIARPQTPPMQTPPIQIPPIQTPPIQIPPIQIPPVSPQLSPQLKPYSTPTEEQSSKMEEQEKILPSLNLKVNLSPEEDFSHLKWGFNKNKRGSARVQRLKSPVGQKKRGSSRTQRLKSPVGRKKSPVDRKKRGSARVQRLKSPVGRKKRGSAHVQRFKSPVGRKKSPVGQKKSHKNK